MLSEIIYAAFSGEMLIEDAAFENEGVSALDLSGFRFDSVRFVKCRFDGCEFNAARFNSVSFENSDISNCRFKESLWRKSVFLDSKAVGSCFIRALFRDAAITGCDFRYANLEGMLWVGCVVCA